MNLTEEQKALIDQCIKENFEKVEGVFIEVDGRRIDHLTFDDGTFLFILIPKQIYEQKSI